jgi:hypothetical protein
MSREIREAVRREEQRKRREIDKEFAKKRALILEGIEADRVEGEAKLAAIKARGEADKAIINASVDAPRLRAEGRVEEADKPQAAAREVVARLVKRIRGE